MTLDRNVFQHASVASFPLLPVGGLAFNVTRRGAHAGGLVQMLAHDADGTKFRECEPG